MERSLSATLALTPRLPDGWSPPSIEGDVIVADGIELHRVGLASSSPEGEEVTGSAAGVDEAPRRRAQFELLERIATVEAVRSAPQQRTDHISLLSAAGAHVGEARRDVVFPLGDDPGRWRYARSNGVALHSDWGSACERALWELAERDRILRSWLGELLPERLDVDGLGLLAPGGGSYTWAVVSFPDPEPSWSEGIEVAGVLGFPRTADAPFVSGYGARATLEDAIAAARTEALQVLAFLWAEAIPDARPAPGPTAHHHLERLLWPAQHDRLRRWLAGEHRAFRRPGTSVVGGPTPAFVDLTPTWLDPGLRIAKAICAAATPLIFGDSPLTAHLPEDLRAHPVA